MPEQRTPSVSVALLGDFGSAGLRVKALGSVARGINGPTEGQSNQSSPGYVLVHSTSTIVGITEPTYKIF